jgi:CRISPR/Cas system-associated protein endoribonuclease Cas2
MLATQFHPLKFIVLKLSLGMYQDSVYSIMIGNKTQQQSADSVKEYNVQKFWEI